MTDIRLSIVEYEILWADLRLGEMPYPLWVPSHGRTQAERADIRAEAWRTLADRGLFSAGRPEPDLEEVLGALAQPRLAVDLVGNAGRVLRAVAVSGRGPAVLAALDDQGLVISRLGTASLTRSIVRLLPPADAGPGHSMSVPLDTLARAGAAGDTDDDYDSDPFGNEAELTEVQALVRLGVPAADATYLTELAAARWAGGQFGVSADRRRSEVIISWFDTHAGRYLMVGDKGWMSVAPADPDRISQRIDAAITALTR